MKTITLTIDDKKIEAREGDILLWVALDRGIYIPNLCALRERERPFAGCRLCFVEIKGYPEPVTACTEPVQEGMIVTTKTDQVLQLQRSAFELILSTHHVDCKHCGKNKSCELQRIAAHLKVTLKPKRLRLLPKNLPVDDSHPRISYDPNKCVLCGKCVWVCREKQGVGTLNFAYRGFAMTVTTFGQLPFSDERGIRCEACVKVCPVGALLLKDSQDVVEK